MAVTNNSGRAYVVCLWIFLNSKKFYKLTQVHVKILKYTMKNNLASYS